MNTPAQHPEDTYPPAIVAAFARAAAGDNAGAVQACQAFIADHPDHACGYDALALLLCGTMKLNQAREAFTKAIACANATPAVYLHFSKLWIAMHVPQNAVEVLRQAAAKFGPLLDLQLAAAVAYGHSMKDRPARQICEALIAREPDNALFWDTYAHALFQAGQSADALAACERAYALKPDSVASIGVIYANLLTLYGKQQESAKIRTERFDTIGQNPQLRLKELEALEREGDTKHAEQHWRAAVDGAATSSDAYASLAQNLFRQNRTQEALTYLTKAKALPASPQLSVIIRALERSGVEYANRVAALAAQPLSAQPTSLKDTIVIRGTVEDRFLDVIKSYRAAHPGVYIILSTWRDARADLLAAVAPYVDETVLNDRPQLPGSNNINYQIVCAAHGVARARERGAERILVTRTDLALLRPNVLSEFADLIAADTPDAALTPGLRKRLIICDLYTLLAPFYHASDIFCYGTADDVANYWSLDHLTEICQRPEVILCRGFAKKVGRALANQITDALPALQDLFIIRDAETLELYWQKYPSANSLSQTENHTLVTQAIWSGARKPLLNVAEEALPRVKTLADGG